MSRYGAKNGDILRFYKLRDFAGLADSNLSAAIDQNGNTIMHVMAGNLDTATIREILDRNPDAVSASAVNAVNSQGNTPLDTAVARPEADLKERFVNFWKDLASKVGLDNKAKTDIKGPVFDTSKINLSSEKVSKEIDRLNDEFIKASKKIKELPQNLRAKLPANLEDNMKDIQNKLSQIKDDLKRQGAAHWDTASKTAERKTEDVVEGAKQVHRQLSASDSVEYGRRLLRNIKSGSRATTDQLKEIKVLREYGLVKDDDLSDSLRRQLDEVKDSDISNEIKQRFRKADASDLAAQARDKARDLKRDASQNAALGKIKDTASKVKDSTLELINRLNAKVQEGGENRRHYKILLDDNGSKRGRDSFVLDDKTTEEINLKLANKPQSGGARRRRVVKVKVDYDDIDKYRQHQYNEQDLKFGNLEGGARRRKSVAKNDSKKKNDWVQAEVSTLDDKNALNKEQEINRTADTAARKFNRDITLSHQNEINKGLRNAEYDSDDDDDEDEYDWSKNVAGNIRKRRPRSPEDEALNQRYRALLPKILEQLSDVIKKLKIPDVGNDEEKRKQTARDIRLAIKYTIQDKYPEVIGFENEEAKITKMEEIINNKDKLDAFLKDINMDNIYLRINENAKTREERREKQRKERDARQKQRTTRDIASSDEESEKPKSKVASKKKKPQEETSDDESEAPKKPKRKSSRNFRRNTSDSDIPTKRGKNSRSNLNWNDLIVTPADRKRRRD